MPHAVTIGTVLIATVIYWSSDRGKENWFINSFSAIANGKRIFAAGQSDMDCLHGLRFLSIAYVAFGHRFMMDMIYPSVNSLYLVDWILEYPSMLVIGGTVCVDTFMLISSMLVGYVFLNTVTETNKFNLLFFYLYRYMRITIPLVYIVLVYANLISVLGSGPIWYNTYTALQRPCQKFWWSTLLHIQAYVNNYDLCIIQTWYLTVDMMLYYLSPIILYPHWKWPSFGFINHIIFYILSVASSFFVAWFYEFEGGMPLTRNLVDILYFQLHYSMPHTRAPPYIMGLGFGITVYKMKNKKVQLHVAVRIAGWTMCILFMIFAVFGAHVFQDATHAYNRLESSAFLALSRSAWSAGIIWIIFACLQGYGGLVNTFLSLHLFRVLGRISYSIFLTHMLFQYLNAAAAKIPFYYADFCGIYRYGGDLLFVITLAFLYAICFEYPFVQLQKVMISRSGARSKVMPEVIKVK